MQIPYNKQRVQFGQLSTEDVEYLKARVAVKLCPDCNLKAEFKIINHLVAVDNICCNKFAEIIGDSLSIKNINNFAIDFRGRILNIFSLLEVYVDAIITLVQVQFPANFAEINIPRKTEDLTIRERKLFLKICLEKYQTLTTYNIDKMWGHFNNIVEKRNHLAHWPVDTTKSALELLEKSNRIRFININGDKEEDTYNSKTTAELVDKIEKLTIEIMKVFKFFSHSKK